MRDKIRIGVIGGSSPPPQALEQAFQVGRLIARAGAILVCGGLGGVMEAASRGAKEEGGTVIGILPGQDFEAANPYVDIPIATAIGYLRNALVVLNSHVLIAVDGSYGTLTEISYGLIYGRKVFGIGTWDIPGVIAVSGPEQAVERALKEAKNAYS